MVHLTVEQHRELGIWSITRLTWWRTLEKRKGTAKVWHDETRWERTRERLEAGPKPDVQQERRRKCCERRMRELLGVLGHVPLQGHAIFLVLFVEISSSRRKW